MSEYIISVKNLNKVYNKTVKALDDVSLDVKKGELLVILGTSGDGKSTLLNMIGAMDKPDSGSVLFNGEDICKYSSSKLNNYRKENVGFVFQAFNLINDVTVYENILLQLSLLKNSADPLNILDEVGLKDKANSYPSELSGGQQQRVSIARAFGKNASLILCDEPTGALDYNTGKKILELIENMIKEHNSTVIFVTHTKEIAKMADHVIVMESGKIKENYYNETKLSAKDIEW